jgi:hypothetical protein
MLIDKPDVDQEFLSSVRKLAMALRRKLVPHPLSKWTLEQMLEHTSRRKTARTLTIGSEKKSNGELLRRSVVHFTKVERTHKPDKAPRGVVYCNQPQYNFVVAQYTKPYEHFFFNVRAPADWPLAGTRVVVKGLDSLSRGELLADIYGKIVSYGDGAWHFLSDGDDCLMFLNNKGAVTCVSVDITGFDVHTRIPVLRLFATFVGRCFSDPQEWYSCMNMAYNSKGRSAGGTVKVTFEGNLCSGDMFTSICGVTVMVMLLYASIIQLTTKNWLAGIKDWFLKAGYKLKLEKVVELTTIDDISHIEFTQMHPIRTFYGWRMVPNPAKVLAAAGHVTGWGPTVADRGSRLRAIGYSELAMSQGVPVLQEHALWLLAQTRLFARGELSALDLFKFKRERRNHLPMWAVEVTAQARADFSRSYGISVVEQIAMEERFKTLHVNLTSVSSGRAPSTLWDHSDSPLFC